MFQKIKLALEAQKKHDEVKKLWGETQERLIREFEESSSSLTENLLGHWSGSYWPDSGLCEIEIELEIDNQYWNCIEGQLKERGCFMVGFCSNVETSFVLSRGFLKRFVYTYAYGFGTISATHDSISGLLTYKKHGAGKFILERKSISYEPKSLPR